VTGTLGVALRVLIAEGPAAGRDRWLDRLEEWRWRRSFPAARNGSRLASPIINVLATKPARRLGGLQIQFLRRLEGEAEERACAVLYPEASRYRLERRHAARREGMEIPGPVVPSPVSLEDAVFEAAVLRAAEAAGATALHVEGLSGIPPASLLALERRGLSIILSLHDFALFCPRPDLLEQPASRFCGYSRDLGRCRACLGQHWKLAPDFQARYREVGGELLRRARAVVYPSSYLRSKFLDLVPGLDRAVQRVIEPASWVSPAAPARAPRPPRHVAFVGAVHVRKGALVFEELVRRAGGEWPALRWSALGGGDPQLLRRLSRLRGLAVRGYYRAGTLPALLRKRRVDVALLLSIVPEPYGLTLDECQQAGVPVIAFDHGALGERVRAGGGGIVVPLAEGCAGVLAALRDVLDGRRRPSWPAPSDASPAVGRAALAHLRLYRELGLLPPNTADGG
jgi:glycosyltransferase involved in cell wall biosynthesis